MRKSQNFLHPTLYKLIKTVLWSMPSYTVSLTLLISMPILFALFEESDQLYRDLDDQNCD